MSPLLRLLCPQRIDIEVSINTLSPVVGFLASINTVVRGPPWRDRFTPFLSASSYVVSTGMNATRK